MTQTSSSLLERATKVREELLDRATKAQQELLETQHTLTLHRRIAFTTAYEAGIPQKTIAEASGLTPASVNRIIKGIQ